MPRVLKCSRRWENLEVPTLNIRIDSFAKNELSKLRFPSSLIPNITELRFISDTSQIWDPKSIKKKVQFHNFPS